MVAEYLSRSVDPQLLSSSPFEGVSEQDWREWMLHRFEEADDVESQQAIQAILDRQPALAQEIPQ